MGMRFRKSVTLFPGVRLNFSRSGVSTTIGVPGASVNIGAQGASLNLGLPGTGLSYRHQLFGGDDVSPGQSDDADESDGATGYGQRQAHVTPLQSGAVEAMTSPGLTAFERLIEEVFAERVRLEQRVGALSEALTATETALADKQASLFSFFKRKDIEALSENVGRLSTSLDEARDQLAACGVDVAIEVDDSVRSSFDALVAAFARLAACEAIWDVTGTVRDASARSVSTSVERKRVKFSVIEPTIIRWGGQVLRMENANGSDLLVYPTFVLMRRRAEVALIDLREIGGSLGGTRFIESGSYPSDAEVVDTTWEHANKDGSRDMRYRDNRPLPMVRYADLTLQTKLGLHEEWQFSHFESCKVFVTTLEAHKQTLADALAAASQADATGETAAASTPAHAT